MSATNRIPGDHPDDSLLSAWARGALPEQALGEVDEHLEACDSCAARLEQLDLPADPLVQRIQEADQAWRESDVVLAEREESDENLRLAVMALQSGMIDHQQFVEGAMLWSGRPGVNLADVLLEQQWINADDQQQLFAMLRRRMKSKSPPVDATGSGSALSSSPARATVSPWPTLNAKHELRQIHSSGGIGRVWQAYDKILHRDVALKELRAEFVKVPAHRERFRREAYIAAQLMHPGTVPVYELYDDGKRCFYTMKFLAGSTLTQLAERMHAQREQTGEIDYVVFYKYLGYFLQVCDTIAYAHSCGVVHRDLKGENVIVGDFGEVTVIDWGLAKQMEPGATAGTVTAKLESQQSDTLQGDRLGTPSYMSPEQARGAIDEIDARTDVYGLAAMLYEILTGRPPFEGDSIHETLHKVENEPPHPPSQFYPEVDAELEDICLRGLAKRKEGRQPTAKALHDQVQQWLGEQIQSSRIVQQRGQLFAHCLQPLMVVDPQFHITNVNAAWEKLTGFTNEQAKQLRLVDLVHASDLETLREALKHLDHDNSTRTPPLRVTTQQGTSLWLALTLTNLVGEPSIYIICEDRTSRGTELHRLKTVVDEFPDGIALLTGDGKIQFSNARLNHLFGYQGDDLVGKPLDSLFTTVGSVGLSPLSTYLQSALFRTRDPALALKGVRKNGEEIPIDISSNCVTLDNQEFRIVSVRSDSVRAME